jgi:hypothetical protein
VAFGYVQSTGAAVTSASSTTLAVPVTLAPSAGNMLVAGVVSAVTGTTLNSVTDTKGNTWTIISQYSPTSPAVLSVLVAYTLQDVGTLTTSDTITATVSVTSANISAVVDEFTVPAGTISVDLSPVAGSTGVTAVSASGTAVSVGASQTIATAVELVLCPAVTRGNAAQTFTAGAGWAKTQSIVKATGQFTGIGNEYVVTSSRAGQTGTWTLGVSTNWAAVLVSFQATAPPPPSTAANWVVAGITMPP